MGNYNRKIKLNVTHVIILLLITTISGCINITKHETVHNHEQPHNNQNNNSQEQINSSKEPINGNKSVIDNQLETRLHYNIGEFMTNLSDDNVKRYVRLTVEIEISDRNMNNAKILDTRITEIRNNIILLLNSYSAEQLNTATEKNNLKNEIKNMIDSIAQKEIVLDVNFSNLIVQ